MADRDQEGRIRDLKSRVEREPRSRYFIPLAEELRKAGRVAETIGVLEEGLALNSSYVAARVALARAFLEAGRIDDSMAAFSKALQDDPSNLVAAKALGDIHLSRGERTDALKRYLRFRAVSGDRRLDDLIAKLREEIGPSPDAAAAPAPAAPEFAPPAAVAAVPVSSAPPAISFPSPLGGQGRVSPLPPVELWPSAPTRRETDPFDITSVPWAPPPAPAPAPVEPAEEMLSRDVRLDAIPSREPADEGASQAPGIRLPETAWPFAEEADASPPAADEVRTSAALPTGRTLGELYLEQGHYVEAIQMAQVSLAASPEDEGWKRLLQVARERLPAGGPAPLPAEDPGRERRLEKIALLNRWLDRIEKRGRP